MKFCATRVASLLLMSLAALAQGGTNYIFTVLADRPDATYKTGETVTFTIALFLDNQPVTDALVNWTVSKDGAPPLMNGTVRLAGQTATVTGKLDEPGFLQCRVSFAGPDKVVRTALGGAAVDPLLIKPSLPAPADFDEFWVAQTKRLAAIPMNARLTPVQSPASGVDCFDVQADGDGPPVSGYLARRTLAKPKSLPIILLVHGAGVRSSNLGNAADWAKQGFLAMDLNAHGVPNGQPEEFYKSLADGRLNNYSQQGREARDAIYFRGMFLRLVRAIDVLTAQPEWNGRTVVVHGSSQGGWQAIVAAALDSRVTFFAAGVPAGCDHTGVMADRVNGWPQFLAGPPAKPDTDILEAVRYYDAVNFATRINTPGILSVGFIDTTCPPTGVYAAFNALSARKAIFNDIPSGHAISQSADAAMRAAIFDHAGLFYPTPFQYQEGQAAPRTEVRDPCIIREGDTYYLVFTMWPFRNREEKFLGEPDQGGSPGIALYSSRDLKSWKFENWLVKSSELPENSPYKNRFWAPEIHKIGGRFYLVFTGDNWLKKEFNPAGTWGSAGYPFVGSADKITGPYEHITWLRGAGCDTTLFGDADGTTYAFIPRGDLEVQAVDLQEMKLVGKPQRIVTADNADIGIAAKPEYLEGPWVEKMGAKYCLFYAEIYRDRNVPDWRGYWTGVATADHPLGPWKKDPRGRIVLRGHLAVFDGPDDRKWFSYRGESDDAAHGKLCIAPVNREQP